MSFYVTLPSNYHSEDKPCNTQSDYTTLLAQQIDLKGEYEVSLVEIDYSTNIKCNMGKLVIKKYIDSVFNIKLADEDLIVKCLFKNKISPVEFIKCLNEQFLIDSEIMILKHSNRIMAEIGDSEYIQQTNQEKLFFNVNFFILGEKLFIINTDENKALNDAIYKRFNGTYYKNLKRWFFDKTQIASIKEFAEKTDIKSIFNIKICDVNDLQRKDLIFNLEGSNISITTNLRTEIIWMGPISQHLFYKPLHSMLLKDSFNVNLLMPDIELDFIKYIVVYCDIIEDQFFGGLQTQVLKLITIDSGKDILVKNTEVLQYLRVRVNRLTSINISLKDMEGNSIMFLDVFAFVIVKLHFRKTNE